MADSYAAQLDVILRRLKRTTGQPLGRWFKVLDKAGMSNRHFLESQRLLSERHRLQHAEATAIAWSYQNPYLLPDDLRGDSDRGRSQSRVEDLDQAVEASRKKAKGFASRTRAAAARLRQEHEAARKRAAKKKKAPTRKSAARKATPARKTAARKAAPARRTAARKAAPARGGAGARTGTSKGKKAARRR
jgi:hypothetical protein